MFFIDAAAPALFSSRPPHFFSFFLHLCFCQRGWRMSPAALTGLEINDLIKKKRLQKMYLGESKFSWVYDKVRRRSAAGSLARGTSFKSFSFSNKICLFQIKCVIRWGEPRAEDHMIYRITSERSPLVKQSREKPRRQTWLAVSCR